MNTDSPAAASAVDVKISGQWWFHYGYYGNNTLVEKNDSGAHSDRTIARQRVRTQFQFIADENLSAMLNMEASSEWGRPGGSGYLDADKTSFVIKRAHLDWTLPGTQVKTRMGIQGITMPNVAYGSHPVLNADVAGISVSSQFTPEIGLTAFWIRPYDTTGLGTTGQENGLNKLDEMDVFGFMLPIKTDAVRATPWGMFALIGKDSEFFGSQAAGSYGVNAKTGVIEWTAPKHTGNASYNYRGRPSPVNGDIDSTSYGWWLGTTFELPILDPFFVKLDAMMGGLETGDSDYDTFGWLVAANIGYKFSWGSLSVRGWYSSGDDDDDDRGYMPIISDDLNGNTMTRYGLGGTYARSQQGIISTSGIGMWGIGLQLADFSFIDGLKHTATVMYMGGTNQGDAIARRDTNKMTGVTHFGKDYLMTSDRAWEINLLSEYRVNQYLTIGVDFAYVWLDLGDHWDNKGDTEGSFATMVGVTYSF